MMQRWILALALVSAFAGPQDRLDLREPPSHTTVSPLNTRPVKVGTKIPRKCTAGELFFKSDAPASANLYGCTAKNVWTRLSSDKPKPKPRKGDGKP